MNEIGLFVSAFVTVFALGFQQKNVNGNHYGWAAVTSLAIGSSQIFLWRVIPTALPTEIVATLLGGPAGIVSAMWLHPKMIRK